MKKVTEKPQEKLTPRQAEDRAFRQLVDAAARDAMAIFHSPTKEVHDSGGTVITDYFFYGWISIMQNIREKVLRVESQIPTAPGTVREEILDAIVYLCFLDAYLRIQEIKNGAPANNGTVVPQKRA